MTARDHDRFADDSGAYVLGALPELEARAFRRHVMGCAECRDEVERLRAAAEALPRSVRPLNAPVSLGRSLMAAVREDEPPRQRRLQRLRRRLRPTLVRMRPATAWISAALLLLAGVAGGYAASTLVGGDQGRQVAATVDRTRLAEASGSLLLPAEGDERARPTLSVNGLPTLPERGRSDSVYQLWLVRQNEVIPSSVFSVGADGSGTAAIPDGLEDVGAVWITRERAGGARAPSEEPVMEIRFQ